MRRFLLICLAQFLSMLGTYTTSFGLGVWLYQRTGSLTLNSWVSQAAILPMLLVAPLTGVLVDRWGPRKAMMAGHLGAAVAPLVLTVLYRVDALHVPAILAMITLGALFNSLHFPAQSLALTLMVPKEQYGQANGVVQFSMAVVQVLSPLMGAWLITRVGLDGVLLTNLATFIVALGILLAVAIPSLPSTPKEASTRGSLRAEMTEGWTYVRQRPGLSGLLVVMGMANFNLGMLQILVVPLVLGFADTQALGTIQSFAGVGMLLGGVFMMFWGGPQRRILAALGFLMLQGVLLLMGGARVSVWLVAVGAFGIMGSLTLIVGSLTVVWQRKVPIALQGRVFSVRRVVAQAMFPLAYALAGPLVDDVFEPLMAQGGRLAGSVGTVLGVGSGRGVALLLVLLGVMTVTTAVLCFLAPRLRRLEEDLPDAEEDTVSPAPMAAAS
ncbi:major facilitator family transporter [Myxococcus stipitatus DSM 14675]|uniref:Major facilitator family transporter n=1 Tax=Myxococcus stipitatus (strain DSM 14675 / JCM 12634 / Mx s8) TaxID=1278073 RepID=L7U6A4_MYXSD|nr:MFS transporter [Myxococcus stipitatus]AGC43385.1 major facilitator family transporter [Myxococcus stipitatus DSM 14675]